MRTLLLACGLLLSTFSLVDAYVEAPHSLGRVCQESTNIVLVEVTKLDKERGLIIFKKLQDIKGKHPQTEIKHNIGKRGFHPREWQNVMNWAETGKKAVFFHNGGASETCTGTYWYQCYREGEWWGMSHAEPFLLRTFCGDSEKLAAAVTALLQGREVVVPCMVDGSKDQLHQRKGKLQLLKASLKLLDYNPRRDFVAFGGDGGDIPEFKTVLLLAESSAGWKFLPAAAPLTSNNRWQGIDFDDSMWRRGQAPIGYGEDEIRKRKGTTIAEKGMSFLFRREFQVPGELLSRKGVVFRLGVASDDSAVVFLNGKLADQDPVADHEFAYWNRDLDIPGKLLRPGRNLIAVLVKNRPGSSDLYLDMEIAAQVPVERKIARPVAVAKRPTTEKLPALPMEKLPPSLVIDKQKRTVSLPCAIAPRKLPNLKDIYPIEVLATYPAPAGQKAHETVVTFAGVKPSMVHQALLELGLKPGRPARGEDARATGPELALYLEVADANGKKQRLPFDKALRDRSGKQLGQLTWHFTGSAFRQPDPEKDVFVYGANLTGTLVAIFPVTDDTVIQSNLTLKDETQWRLETMKGLPREGTTATLIIQAR